MVPRGTITASETTQSLSSPLETSFAKTPNHPASNHLKHRMMARASKKNHLSTSLLINNLFLTTW